MTNEFPRVAVDAVLFAVDNFVLKVLLIKINDGPYKDKWCIPGGLVGINESLDDAAKRVLFQKANISNVHLEQLYTFGNVNRDVRSRSISVAYFALVPAFDSYNVRTTSYYSQISWHEVGNLPDLAFDHPLIIKTAHERLKSKLDYSNIAYSLLPEHFTLTQMQKVYEAILQKPIDKRNFRKKVVLAEIVEKSPNQKSSALSSRPAQLYHFRSRELIYLS